MGLALCLLASAYLYVRLNFISVCLFSNTLDICGHQHFIQGIQLVYRQPEGCNKKVMGWLWEGRAEWWESGLALKVLGKRVGTSCGKAQALEKSE